MRVGGYFKEVPAFCSKVECPRSVEFSWFLNVPAIDFQARVERIDVFSALLDKSDMMLDEIFGIDEAVRFTEPIEYEQHIGIVTHDGECITLRVQGLQSEVGFEHRRIRDDIGTEQIDVVHSHGHTFPVIWKGRAGSRLLTAADMYERLPPGLPTGL